MNHLKNRFNTILSFNFLLLTVIVTLILFFFLDIPLFEASRSLGGFYFYFFNEIIDPLSDILDPLNVMIISILVLIIIRNYNKITKQPKKLVFLEKSLDKKSEEIFISMNYYYNIFKHVLYSLIFAGIICHLFKYLLGVSRPKYFFLEGYDRNNFFNWEHKVNALPSGHTQAAFSLAILFVLYVNRFHLIILSTAILMGLSRIFMSMHFPSDLIFGAYIGALVPLIIYKVGFESKFKKINKKNLFDFRSFLKLLYLRIFI